MKDFKKMPKMACGGSVSKYEDGGKVTPKFKKEPSATVLTKEVEAYQDSPEYASYEDLTPVGLKARKAVEKAYREPSTGSYDLGKPNNPRTDAVRKAAKNVIAKDREQVKTMSNVDAMGNPLKRGGKVKRGKVTKK